MQRLSHRLFLYLSMIAFLASPICLAKGQTSSAQIAPFRIGYLMDSLKIERWQTDLDIFQKEQKSWALKCSWKLLRATTTCNCNNPKS